MQDYGQNNRRSGHTGLQTEQQEVRSHRERTEQCAVRPDRAMDRTTGGGQNPQGYGQNSRRSGHTGLHDRTTWGQAMQGTDITTGGHAIEGCLQSNRGSGPTGYRHNNGRLH